jgi:hypothetical protein
MCFAVQNTITRPAFRQSLSSLSLEGIVNFSTEVTTDAMKIDRSRYSGNRFPPEIISYAIWTYHRFCLSLRDVEDLLAKRGIIAFCPKIASPDQAARS